MLLWMMATMGMAADDVAEEIIIYGDDYARWDETRWFVQTEMWAPLGVWFASDQNLEFESNIFQIRAIVFCTKDEQLSKKKWQVDCKIEDIALRVTSARNWRREKDRTTVQTVLDEVDTKLTGKVIQLQVDERGGVTNFDLEGITTANQRERRTQETLRQIIQRTMAGFHLRIPDHAQRSGQWVEYNSELMEVPSLTSARGSSTLVHQVSPYQGLQIVQTVGEGTMSVQVPNRRMDDGFVNFALSDAGGNVSSPGAAAGARGLESAVTVNTGAGAELDLEATYTLKAVGVAVFRKSDGIMSERVWAVDGRSTASSAGGVDTGPFRNAGRIQLLAEGEQVSVGESKQVAWPGKTMEGLDPWVWLDAMPSAKP